MAGRKARSLYATYRWKRTRRAVLDRAGWRCSACGRAGRLEVHHVHAVARDGDPFDMANLRALCRVCHFDRHRAANRAAGRGAMRPDRRAWAEERQRVIAAAGAVPDGPPAEPAEPAEPASDWSGGGWD